MRKLMPVCFLLMAACSGLSPLTPAPEEAVHRIRKDCARIFPAGKWQLVHTIETLWPNNQSGTFIGVTMLSSDSGRIDAVVSTIEGFTVFDASYDRQMHIRRAIPPFDSHALALGLFKDIRLMFLKPRDPQPIAGFDVQHAAACRYRKENGGVVEVVLAPPDQWQIHQYSAGGRLLRTVTAEPSPAEESANDPPIPSRIELVGYAGVDYRLKLELLEAVRISESPGDAR